MPANYFLAIDYDDHSVEDRRLNVYRAVVLTLPDMIKAAEPDIRFATNDPVEDFKSAHRLVYALQLRYPASFMFSSSVNDFVVDCYGYRFDEAGYLELDPEEPLFKGETIPFKTLSQDEKLAVAVTKSCFAEARGAAYLHQKECEVLEPFFLKADHTYREFCHRFGLDVQPIFDETHYRRERVACGDALFTEVYGTDKKHAGIALGRKDLGHVAAEGSASTIAGSYDGHAC
ncbi:hypothetical protein KIKIMORA_01070 [Brevundimonas phage vB_BpoS-Kikimora]|uniref:Uncharacterized protein n=1 Tax=Brevundimonas phage vB_BpoS-Kikimora TaxID=2948601 RepID=A0A9E7MRV7_9CAUD|nr:hypothetical protein KIKIMORA_01070 [Brevundimonas phage vB_BpoS-Kikimora]